MNCEFIFYFIFQLQFENKTITKFEYDRSQNLDQLIKLTGKDGPLQKHQNDAVESAKVWKTLFDSYPQK